MKRRVSVVIAVYNGAWCIERALESLARQTRRADEVLVCDDGSTDGTADLIERRFGDFVTVLRLPHRNASATRRIGLERANGDWLAFMDADDWWKPEKLERQLAYLDRHPEVRWCGTDGEFVSSETLLRPSWLSEYFDPVYELRGDLLPQLIERCFPLLSSMLVDRDAYHEVGGLNPEIPLSYDYDLWLRLAARYPGAMLPEALIYYFFHAGSLSRRIEARLMDDLSIMNRVARGEIMTRPDVKWLAVNRAAALEFNLALTSFRNRRMEEGRERMRRASAAGPLGRRMLAAAGAILPGRAVPWLVRSFWLKDTLRRNRRRPPVFRPGDRA